MKFNPAHGENGPVADALRSLFRDKSGDLSIGSRFKIGERVVKRTGARVLALFALPREGPWQTFAVFDGTTLHLRGTVAENADFEHGDLAELLVPR